MEKKRGVPIKTKLNYPFVYFLIEQNTVLVYRIENDECIKGADLIESGNVEVYDVDSAEDFESFNHLNSNQPEGTSIFMNHRDLDKLAEEINEQIQKNRFY